MTALAFPRAVDVMAFPAFITSPFVEVETAVGGMLLTSIRDAVHDLCGIDGQTSAHSVTTTSTD